MANGRIFAVVTVYDTQELLPHFLDHYTRLGVDEILVAANVEVEGADTLATRFPVSFTRVRYGAFSNQDKDGGEEAMLVRAGARPDDWVLHLDLDEFHQYPAALRDVVRLMERRGLLAVAGRMFDRVAADGTLRRVERSPGIGEQFPLGGRLTHGLVRGNTRKIMVARRDVRLVYGRHDTLRGVPHGHYPVGTRRDYLVHHFRWTDGLLERLERRFLPECKLDPRRSYCRQNLDFCRRYRSDGRIDLRPRHLGVRVVGPFRYPPENPLLHKLALMPAGVWPPPGDAAEILTALARFLRVRRVVELGDGRTAPFWASMGRKVDVVRNGSPLRADVQRLINGLPGVMVHTSGWPEDEKYDLAVFVATTECPNCGGVYPEALTWAGCHARVAVVLDPRGVNIKSLEPHVPPSHGPAMRLRPSIAVIGSPEDHTALRAWARGSHRSALESRVRSARGNDVGKGRQDVALSEHVSDPLVTLHSSTPSTHELGHMRRTNETTSPQGNGLSQGTDCRVVVFTVSDRAFFPGTLATVNSVLHFHNYPVVVIDNGLTEPQRNMLVRGGVRVVPATTVAAARHIGAWELKAYAARYLAPEADVLVGIDSDCLLCSPIDDQMRRCLGEQTWLGGKDGGSLRYDRRYAPYGIPSGAVNNKYMSTSLYFCPISPGSLATLDRWSECCDRSEFNGRGAFAGHGDQGVLNAILYQSPGQRVEALPNRVWSQHWTYWSDVVAYNGTEFVNHSAGGVRQRSFHCGGAEKFWAAAHVEKLATGNASQADAFAWYLGMLFFGRCSDRVLDPWQYLPEQSHHLVGSLVNHFHRCQFVHPDVRRRWPTLGDAFLARVTEGIHRMMSLGGSMSDYVGLVRSLPDGARVVEVGSYEGGSVVTAAVACLDRDITFHSVESWTGNLNGTMDGFRLPDPLKYNQNVHQRYPHLRVNSCPCPSAAAVQTFADHSVDLVFVDACHDTASVVRDIGVWRQKVKPGGIIAGDDWSWPSVATAVRRELGEPQVTRSNDVWWLRL